MQMSTWSLVVTRLQILFTPALSHPRTFPRNALKLYNQFLPPRAYDQLLIRDSQQYLLFRDHVSGPINMTLKRVRH